MFPPTTPVAAGCGERRIPGA